MKKFFWALLASALLALAGRSVGAASSCEHNSDEAYTPRQQEYDPYFQLHQIHYQLYRRPHHPLHRHEIFILRKHRGVTPKRAGLGRHPMTSENRQEGGQIR